MPQRPRRTLRKPLSSAFQSPHRPEWQRGPQASQGLCVPDRYKLEVNREKILVLNCGSRQQLLLLLSTIWRFWARDTLICSPRSRSSPRAPAAHDGYGAHLSNEKFPVAELLARSIRAVFPESSLCRRCAPAWGRDLEPIRRRPKSERNRRRRTTRQDQLQKVDALVGRAEVSGTPRAGRGLPIGCFVPLRFHLVQDWSR